MAIVLNGGFYILGVQFIIHPPRELTITGSTGSGSVMQSRSSLLLDGEAISLTAYTIADNNCFKLRDLCQLLHFDVRWELFSLIPRRIIRCNSCEI